MLVPAITRKEEINELWNLYIYDIDYQYYHGSEPTSNFHWDCDGFYYWASIDTKTDEVIGVITYHMDRITDTASRFGIISFDWGNPVFLADLGKVIDDIFYTYGANRMEWEVVADNERALMLYELFAIKSGGRKIGIRKEAVKTMDGQLHDSISFEILASRYKKPPFITLGPSTIPTYLDDRPTLDEIIMEMENEGR